MQNLENQIVEFRQVLLKHNERVTVLEQDMAVIKESLLERRRREDRVEETLVEIKEVMSDIQQKLFGYKSTALAIFKTTIVITTFFSALGAAIWALVTKIYEHTP